MPFVCRCFLWVGPVVPVVYEYLRVAGSRRVSGRIGNGSSAVKKSRNLSRVMLTFSGDPQGCHVTHSLFSTEASGSQFLRKIATVL